MIIKELEAPLRLVRMERLLKRLDHRHPKRLEIELDMLNIKQGYDAEKSLLFYLDRIGAHRNDMVVLHDIRLVSLDGKSCFQMDCLLLTPQFALIIEVKSHGGTFTYEHDARKFQYLINKKKYVMDDPILQVE